MINSMHRFAASILALGLALSAFTASAATITAPNNPPDLGTTPPDLSQSVDPNIVVTFDDSGSMQWTNMGDRTPYNGGSWDGPWRCANVIDPRVTDSKNPLSRAMNGVYYNPNVTYTPPLYEDGASFPNADATLKKVWRDGIAVNRPLDGDKKTASTAAHQYYNNSDGSSAPDSTSVTDLTGEIGPGVLKCLTDGTGTGCNKKDYGRTKYCPADVTSDGDYVAGSCSKDTSTCDKYNKCYWNYQFKTIVDNRWMCGGGGTSGHSGQSQWSGARSTENPFDGTHADPDTGATPNGGPVYWRFKAGAEVLLTIDSSTGKFTPSAITALYDSDNWEAVSVPVGQYQNFANWFAYYRYRNLMARTSMSRVFGVIGTPTSSNIRVAWQNLGNNSNFNSPSQLPSSTIITNLDNNTTLTQSGGGSGTVGYRHAFFNWIYNVKANSGTPSRQAAIRAGQFFMRGNTGDLKDPYWQPGSGGQAGQELACRQNFHLLMTDGLYNGGTAYISGTDPTNTSSDVPALGPAPANPLLSEFPASYTASASGKNPTSIYYGGADTDGSDTYSNIAFYYWANNLRPDLKDRTAPHPGNDAVPQYFPDQTVGVTAAAAAVDSLDPGNNSEVFWNPANDPATWPHVVQFAVSLGASGTLTYSDDLNCNLDDGYGIGNDDACKLRTGAVNSSGAIGWPQPNGNGNGIAANIDDLWHAAINSRGAFFLATDPSGLVQHLSDIIQSVLARSQASTSEAVSSNILPASGTTLGYAGGYDSGSWYGYVYQYTLDGATGVATEANWDAGCILTGGSFTKIAPTATTPPRGSCKVSSPPPPPPVRNIFTSVKSGGALVGAPFQWSSLGTDEKAMLNLDPTTTDVDAITGQVITTTSPTAPALDDGNGSDRVKYLRGLRDNETAPTSQTIPRQFRIRQSLLGPIVNSQVIYEGGPSSGLSDIFPADSPEEKAARPCLGGLGASGCNSYEKYVDDNITRKPLVYVGGNDGMLHAFDASTGEEQWAYVPNMLYGNGQLDQLTNPKSGLVTTVDDTPIISDMFLSDKKWHTILIGSMRLGGRGIYALDITDQSKPGSDAAAAAKFKWEFTSANDADLGYTYASANTARLSNGKWVVLLASGYYPQKLQVNSATNGLNGTVDKAPGASANITHLWVLDANDGSVIKKFDTPIGTTSYGMSTPGVIDYGLDQIDDVAVAGDLAGNLWRFDLTDSDPTKWQVKAMFQTYDNPSPCTAINTTGFGCEPIAVQPVAFPDPETGGVILVFGSGEYLGPSDRTSDSVKGTNHFFGVRDLGAASSLYPLHESDLVSQTLTQSGTDRLVTDNPVPKSKSGWMIPLNVDGVQGERAVVTVTPIYPANVAVLTSLIPGSHNDPCTPGRQGAVMAVNAATGGPLIAPASAGGSVKVGSLVDNPPAVGGVSVLGRVGGGYVVPGVGIIGSGTNGSLDLNFARIWRRTSWRQLLDNL